ncbi:tripartite tricarboxylate transporter TctB family protein [Kaustia mangrovi]|uniref:Tripartite tricarboxylate transporter TctB family protein n=1 Tax=Kaustia mangrovi TaxID=2593653 RepID=A0A7S8C0Y3_9HYPH|nr:tripartite tricarboxylate transporter TctB family protein [Kaustia mangrovi]
MAYEGAQLSIGTLTRIGPGFFPTGLGLLILLLGLATAFETEDIVFARNSVRALLCISLAILTFAVTVERLGLIVATAGVVLLTSLAHGRPTIRTVSAVTAFLSVLGILLFITMLRIPLNPVF